MSDWDVIIIGSGPAGLGAATTLGARGVKVLVLDEAATPGGQIWRTRESASERKLAVLGPDYAKGLNEIIKFRQSGVTFSPLSPVWRIEPDGRVWFHREGRLHQTRARRILLATGAMERPVPLPGWTLPGVTTIGALQILLKREGMVPQGPLGLIGTGPLFYLYAAQLVAAGKKDITLVDTRGAAMPLAGAAHLLGAVRGYGPGYLRKGLGLLARLRAAGIRHFRGADAVKISASDGGLQVDFTAKGIANSLQFSRLGLHQGVIAETHLARSLGCVMDWQARSASYAPRRDNYGQSSLENIYIAGDAGGIGGAEVALIEGKIAGLAMLQAMGYWCDPLAEQSLFREKRAHLAARPLIEALYAPPHSILRPDDAVLACRCEEVSCGDIRQNLRAGSAGPNQVKGFLRCGMGPCQGRLCGPTLAALTAEHYGQKRADEAYLTIRTPLRPITLGEVCELDLSA